MPELLLLRHAKSSWSTPANSDHERPLNDRGRTAAPRMGELCRTLDLVPDLILCSNSVRTMETHDLFAAAAEFSGEVRFLPELYHATASELLEALGEAGPASRVLLLAHNPGMEDLFERLSGEYEPFPTAALAAFKLAINDWNSPVTRERSQLIGLWKPRELPN